MKDASLLKKQMFLSMLTFACLVSSMLTKYITPSYTAQVIVSAILIISALWRYHITNKYEKGGALLVNLLGTAGFVFMGASNIAEPYVGPVGSIVLSGLALLLIVPVLIYEVIDTKKTINKNDDEE